MRPRSASAQARTEVDFYHGLVNDLLVPVKRISLTPCDGCQWPERCRQDRLCWQAEKEDIRKNGLGGMPARAHSGYWTRERIIEAMQAWAREHGRSPTSMAWHVAKYPLYPSYKTVGDMFGSFADGCVAAGLEKPRRGWKSKSLKKNRL